MSITYESQIRERQERLRQQAERKRQQEEEKQQEQKLKRLLEDEALARQIQQDEDKKTQEHQLRIEQKQRLEAERKKREEERRLILESQHRRWEEQRSILLAQRLQDEEMRRVRDDVPPSPRRRTTWRESSSTPYEEDFVNSSMMNDSFSNMSFLPSRNQNGFPRVSRVFHFGTNVPHVGMGVDFDNAIPFPPLGEFGGLIGTRGVGMSYEDLQNLQPVDTPAKNRDQLPQYSYKKPQTNNNNETPTAECSICLSEYSNGDSIKVLPCTHRFHTQCIDTWLDRHNTCPVCKLNIDA